MKKLKFGLIGCGRISKKHFEAIAEIKNAEIIACSDILQERMDEAAQKYNISKKYPNYIDMFENENLDAAIICTPSGTHAEIGIEAAKRKINVITEKPMAIKLEDADSLIKECDHNKVSLFVVKQNRLNPLMKILKNAIQKNRFGKIYMVQSNVFWQRPQSYYDAEKWRGTWEFDGGAFTNQASHYVDALYWLIGPVQSVMAETATMARKIEVEDTGSAILKFRNGAIGTINVTMLTYPKNFEGSITIIGEKGIVKLGGIAINKIEKWEFAEYDDDDRYIEEYLSQNKNIFSQGHLDYYKNVVNTLLGNCEASTDGRSGRKSLEIIHAIYKSARERKEISLPLL